MLVVAVAIGVPAEQFWRCCPRALEIHEEAWELAHGVRGKPMKTDAGRLTDPADIARAFGQFAAAGIVRTVA